MAAPIVKVFSDAAKVQLELCTLIESVSKEIIAKRGMFVIGVSGGSLAKVLCDGLLGITTEWDKWRILFCDERVVPFTDDDSTYKFYKENLFAKVPELKDEQVLKINPDLPVSECAADYCRQILQLYSKQQASSTRPKFIPKLDMALLGMGPDGHTCSLFPDHPLLLEEDLLVASIDDSPKPPPQRLTLTYPILNHAHYVIFVATGQAKADMLKRVIDESLDHSLAITSKLPSARISVEAGRSQLLWYVDKAAASLFPSTHANLMYYLPIE